MSRLIDKAVLLALCSILILDVSNFIWPPVLLLVALTMAVLTIYFSNRRIIGGILITYIILCIMEPMFTFYLPLLFYDCFENKFWWGFAAVGLIFPAIQWYAPWELVLWIGLSLTAVLLSYRTGQYLNLKKEWISLRDTSTELNLLMRRRNKELLEKQDYEIHLATLRERNRIAREIHDHVGHMLSRSILQVAALSTIHKEEPLNGQLVSINETLNLAMNNIRESVHDLHDDSIDLEQSILDITKEMEKKYTLRMDYDMSKNVPRQVKYCFIAIVKEAMSNIVKHSNADTVTIILREHPGIYQLSIEDNGTVSKQADSKNAFVESGIGLSNMRERVEALQGTIHIQDENGFKIFVSIRKQEDAE